MDVTDESSSTLGPAVAFSAGLEAAAPRQAGMLAATALQKPRCAFPTIFSTTNAPEHA
jgi:hypothetical protein